MTVIVTIIFTTLFAIVQQSSDSQKIKGVWDEVSAFYKGKNMYESSHVQDISRLVITDKRWDTVIPKPYFGKKPIITKGTYKLDTNEEPKKYDLMIDKQTIRGIFKIEGDLLTVCYDFRPDNVRPTGFNSCFVQITYRRVKK